MVSLTDFFRNLWINIELKVSLREDLERAWEVLTTLEKNNGETRLETHKRYQVYYNQRLVGDGHMVALHAASIMPAAELPDIVFVSDEHA